VIGSWRFSNFYFFYFTTIGILVPYWGLYLKYLEFTPKQIGELVAIMVLTRVVAPNIWAWVADHLNHKTGSSIGILKLATGAAFVIFCLMVMIEPVSASQGYSAYWSVALITFGFSVFWNACLPQVEAATLNHLAHQRFRYGSIRLWGSVGFVVTVLGVGYALDFSHISVVLYACILSFFAMFLASFLLPTSPVKKPVTVQVVSLRQLLNRKVVIILVLCTLMQASHAPFYTFFSIYLESYGYSKAHIGWLWTVAVAFEILVFMFGYRLLRHYQLTKLLTFTFLVAGARWCIVAMFPDNEMIILASQVLHAITYGLYHSVMIQLIDQFFQGRYQVRGQALYTSISFGVGGSVGSALSGYIWAAYGANMVFYCAGILMLVAGVLSLLLINSQQESIPIRTL
jgi:PPP family 3-phenylpropionic acid transporter